MITTVTKWIRTTAATATTIISSIIILISCIGCCYLCEADLRIWRKEIEHQLFIKLDRRTSTWTISFMIPYRFLIEKSLFLANNDYTKEFNKHKNVYFFGNLQKIWLLKIGCSCSRNVTEKFLNKINGFVVTTVIFYFTWTNNKCSFTHLIINKCSFDSGICCIEIEYLEHARTIYK